MTQEDRSHSVYSTGSTRQAHVWHILGGSFDQLLHLHPEPLYIKGSPGHVILRDAKMEVYEGGMEGRNHTVLSMEEPTSPNLASESNG